MPPRKAERTLSTLAERLRRQIEGGGPIPVSAFMAAANSHYYASRDPLGVAGDFITAPEISQMFGELIGLWLVDLWQRSAMPADAALVELGPGRGTLMADIRRVLARVPPLASAPVHLVETSPVLIGRQRERHPDARWHDDIVTLPDDRPLMIVANEFFDALPIRQLVRADDGWRERMVGLVDSGFAPMPGPVRADPLIPAALRDAPVGSVVEASPASVSILETLAMRITAQGGVILTIDYGHDRAGIGDTLQAVRAHAYADPFVNPGEADLTAHVDFAALGEAAARGGAVIHGPALQGDWLRALGLTVRAQRLAAANPGQADAIHGQASRLADPDQMGSLFKVLAARAPAWAPPAGF